MSTCPDEAVRVFQEIQRLGADSEESGDHDGHAARPELDDAAIEELRSMRRPPLIVCRLLEVTHHVLSAELRSGAFRTVPWETVQKTLAAEDFARRLRGYNIVHLRSNQELARNLCRHYFALGADPPLTYARARRACRAAAALYSWSAQVLREVVPAEELPTTVAENSSSEVEEARNGMGGAWRKTWMMNDVALQTDLHIREATHVTSLTEIVGWGYHNGDAYFLRGQLGRDLSTFWAMTYVNDPLAGSSATRFEGGVDEKHTEVVGVWDSSNNFEMHHAELHSTSLPKAVLRASGASNNLVNGCYTLAGDFNDHQQFKHLQHDVWFRRSTCGRKWVFASGQEDGIEFYSCTDKVLNELGHLMSFGRGSCASMYYCGRRLGKSAIPGSDGRCGPNNGPQCHSCEHSQKKLLSHSRLGCFSPPVGDIFVADSVDLEPAPQVTWVHEGEPLSEPSLSGLWLMRHSCSGDDEGIVDITSHSVDSNTFHGRASGQFELEGQLHGRYIRFAKTFHVCDDASIFLYEGVLEGRHGNQIFGRWSESCCSVGERDEDMLTHLPPFGFPWREFHGAADAGGFMMKRLKEWSFQLGSRYLSRKADMHLVEMNFTSEYTWAYDAVRCVRYRCPGSSSSVSETSVPPFAVQLLVPDACLVEVQVELAGDVKRALTFQHEIALEHSFRLVSLPFETLPLLASNCTGCTTESAVAATAPAALGNNTKVTAGGRVLRKGASRTRGSQSRA